MNDVFVNKMLRFPTAYNEIIQRISQLDPVKYQTTRNYVDGAISYLSPYVSRGVISTSHIYSEILKQGYSLESIEKFIQELTWRDYWQQIWIAKGDDINNDLKNRQKPISNTAIPKAILTASTGIEAIDTAITTFYNTGYLHNHLRMYIASITCNIGRSYWKLPAQWMYYHLLDADWASNALSWQWVAGANSNKKYYANQDNINTYCYTYQKDTFLDVPYETFDKLQTPKVMLALTDLHLETPLPSATPISFDEKLPTLIYNFYNLDPLWKKDIDANRILLLEPSQFKKYPVSQKTINFILALSENISNIQMYVGEFDVLVRLFSFGKIYYKEHPLNKHYTGIEEPRDFIFDVKGYYPSFFAFWKNCKKQLNY
jgi:deoxyribodipyrimidine photo-lyase